MRLRLRTGLADRSGLPHRATAVRTVLLSGGHEAAAVTGETSAALVQLWCVAVRHVLRRRRIYAKDDTIAAVLGQGTLPREAVRHFEANQRLAMRLVSHTLVAWDRFTGNACVWRSR